MKIAYFSPLNPIKSGISDYSEDLLIYLMEKADIDIYVSGFYPRNGFITKNFNIYDIDSFDTNKLKNPYDCSLYQIGNNILTHEWIYRQALKEPGVVVLHDFTLHHMLAEMTVQQGDTKAYLEEMHYAHGEKGLHIAQSFVNDQVPPPWETRALEFPLNRRILEASKGIIIHSYFTRNLLKEVTPHKPVKVIPHYTDICQEPLTDYQIARSELGIDLDVKVIATFGFVTPAKRLEKIINVLARLYSEGYEYKFFIVGEAHNQEELEKQIAQYDPGFTDVVKLTGYLDLRQFTRYMKAADICVNLRYPVHGETSGSLHRLFGMSKPVLVSNSGSFKEYPDDIVIKIDVDDKEEYQIYKVLKMLIKNPEEGWNIGKNSYNFAKQNLGIRQAADAYIQFINGIVTDKYTLEGLVSSIAQLMVELEIDQNEQLIKMCAKSFP